MKLRIEEKISLAEYTTLKVGGVARYFAKLTDATDLPLMVEFAESKGVPILVLGCGSNVLIADGELSLLVIKNELMGMSFKTAENGETLVTAAAGEGWDSFVSMVIERGLAGLENLSGIPGTIGAAPIQNINAYGTSVAEIVESVRVFDVAAKQSRTLTAEECEFGYRDSLFKQSAGANLIVTEVTFRLTSAAAGINLSYRSSSQSIKKFLLEKNISDPTLADVRQVVLSVRKNIGMVDGCFCSAGSFFKNTILNAKEFSHLEGVVARNFSKVSEKLSPWHWSLPDGTIKVSTAFLMECTAYNKRTYGKKRCQGVVGLSPLHSLSIVTEEGATTVDVQDFASLIVREVEENFGITIESEVNFITA
ncbi:MAG: UDP-N-acetylmuramate dehydrogenase [Candidatus Paceibacteria bacterium]|jgi:UDP-N-acetylmuramate dehydrogenase